MFGVLKQNRSLISVMGTLHQGKQQPSTGMPKLNAISENSVLTILNEFLGMRRLFSKWVPRLLTAEQKQKRVENSERYLVLFKPGKKDFLKQNDRQLSRQESMVFCFSTILRKVKPVIPDLKPTQCLTLSACLSVLIG